MNVIHHVATYLPLLEDVDITGDITSLMHSNIRVKDTSNL